MGEQNILNFADVYLVENGKRVPLKRLDCLSIDIPKWGNAEYLSVRMTLDSGKTGYAIIKQSTKEVVAFALEDGCFSVARLEGAMQDLLHNYNRVR